MKLLWTNNFSRRLLEKVLFVGLAEPGVLLLSCPCPSSMWRALGTLRALTDRSRRAVLSDGAAWPPSPRYIPSFRAPEQAVLLSPLPNQFSGMLFFADSCFGQSFLNLYLSVPPCKRGREFLAFIFYVLPHLLSWVSALPWLGTAVLPLQDW